MPNTITIDGTEYEHIRVTVYDRRSHRTDKSYNSDQSGGHGPVWMMWQGINVGTGRYVKSLYGTLVGATKPRLIARVD